MFDIQEHLKQLPAEPGVYLMKDKFDNIIYVGKAKILKNRVRQYFQSSKNHSSKVKSMVKNIDKFEYIIQKCTEIGVHRIVPTEMKRCVVKLDNKDKVKKIDRWRKIAEVASKQSLRNDILEVAQVATFMDLINSLKNFDYVIMAYEKEKDVLLKDVLKNINADTCKIAVIIGPEGGIDDSEAEKLVENGARSVSLGKRILRTETAPIVVAANIMYELES